MARPPGGFTWDARSGRYRHAVTGRFVPRTAVREAIDSALAQVAKRVDALARELRAGAISLDAWAAGMRAEVKAAHLWNGAAAHGGWAQLSAADYGSIGARVRSDYGALERFARAIADGSVPLDGRAARRARLYLNTARRGYEEESGRAADRRGATEERNVRHSADGCEGCKRESARGWVRRGTLTAVGGRTCGPACLCSIDYR